ncbi:MAG: hypothetical protein WBQ93_03415 [Candidatus Competibacter sp.]
MLAPTITHRPATELGYLPQKHPARVQTFALNFGQARVFYSKASPKRRTAAARIVRNWPTFGRR